MTLSLTTITGTVDLPTGETPDNGQVIFQLISWDKDGANIFIPGPVVAPIGLDGGISLGLQTTTTLDGGSLYGVRVVYFSRVDMVMKDIRLSNIAVPATNKVGLATLLQTPAPLPDTPDLLEQVQNALAQALAAVATVEAAMAAIEGASFTDYLRATVAELPTAAQGATDGQTAFVQSTGHFYHFNGTAWVDDGEGALANKADAVDLLVEVERRSKAISDLGLGLQAPGDGLVLAENQDGTPLVGIDNEGYLYGSFRLSMPTAPGDYIASVVSNESGEILLGFDIRDNSPYPRPTLDVPAAPGDYIIPIYVDLDGNVVSGIDIRDGSSWPRNTPVDDVDTGDGSNVSFVDPENQGDFWNAIQTVEDGVTVVRYTSRQWNGKERGFEKRGGVHLAQSHDMAMGIVAIGGGGAGIGRVLPDQYPYHIVDETITRADSNASAAAHAAAFLGIEDARWQTLPTTVALTHPIGSTLESDVAAGSPAIAATVEKIKAARTQLETVWKKVFGIDRIIVSLLEGAPLTDQVTADWHYAGVCERLREEFSEATGQGFLPLVVVNQSLGRRDDGTSEVILAEGNLDWMHFNLGFVIAGPRYPYRLQDGSPSALTPEAATMLSELEAIAVSERLKGNDWYGPSIGAQATLVDRTITVPFTAMSDLILRDSADHGFAVDGVTNGATIESVSVAGSTVILAMTTAPLGESLTVRYAFGETGDRGDGFAANRGSLTDSWSQVSRLNSNYTHYRHARSGRAPIVR